MLKAAAKKKARAHRRQRLKPAEAERIEQIFRRFEAANAHPDTELHYASPYTLLIAVALSAQATDRSVNLATDKLYKVADTPQKMLELGEAGLIPFIASIGLYRTKARNVIALSRILTEKYEGQVPLQRAALEALPGVGAKTASVVLNELGAEAAIAVDTHVFRVARRLGLSKGKTAADVARDLMAVVPQWALTRAHHWLILHGRYVCLARRPKCETCLVADLCPSRALFLGA